MWRADEDAAARLARPEDALASAEIYHPAIEERCATFETELRSSQERAEWIRERGAAYPIPVAVHGGKSSPGRALRPAGPAAAPRGVGGFSVHVRRDRRGR